MRQFFRPAGNLLILAGVLLLVPPATHWWVAARAQSGATKLLDRRPAEKATASLAPRTSRAAAREGEALGRLRLARLGIDAVVFEGTSDETLRKGPGHLRGTAWPGEGASGNCVISAHRDTFFRRLEGARAGDLVKLLGPSGTATYRLETRRVVAPEEVEALSPSSDDRLTLVTCYPFHFIGPAPRRLVWQAHRVEAEVDAAVLR
jgi:sortase A